jgi:LacI family repressor for deo operon, udp, cdd, tsx, nupC, and nupG
MGQSVSIKDIARAAGVSPSTVSRALHGHPRISEDTASRVRRLAQEMGYTPSLPARSLVTRNTATIGLVITHPSDPFLGRLVLGVEETAKSKGYSVFLSSSSRDAVRDQEVVRSFYERRVTGVIIAGSQIDAGYMDLRERFPLPIVLINFPPYPYSISTDNLLGARQAVEHLLQLGHRRIAYIANPRSYLSNLNRLAGYKSALDAYGVPVDECLIVEGDGNLAGATKAIQQLLSLAGPPSAVFCFNDMTAVGVLHALREAALRVPQDCSVIGFDDLELAAYLCPPLTTVHQPRYRLGQRAMQTLLALIEGCTDVQPEVLPPELIVRETTSPVRLAEGR